MLSLLAIITTVHYFINMYYLSMCFRKVKSQKVKSYRIAMSLLIKSP